jgi:nitrogen regulatory protein P-II 1
MRKLEIIIRHSRLTAVKNALVGLNIHGMTLTDIKGFGRQGGHKETYRGSEVVVEFVPKVKLEVVLESEQVEAVIEAVKKAAYTGTVGDGKIFVLPVENVVRIRTGETGREAL